MRVLVVEDQVDLGDVFRDFLLELGHEPTVVNTAEAALARLARYRPDAILLDVQLPGMSGIDFLQLRPVRELGVPIVAVSGVVNETQARECLRLGASDFMGKPVMLERLNEVLMFLEPHAMSRETERTGTDRRHSPRARLAISLRVHEYNGREHEGMLIEVGLSGLKARLTETLEKDTVGRVVFTPPDGGPPIDAMTILTRVDRDGHAFTFVRLGAEETERLRAFVHGPRARNSPSREN